MSKFVFAYFTVYYNNDTFFVSFLFCTVAVGETRSFIYVARFKVDVKVGAVSFTLTFRLLLHSWACYYFRVGLLN